MKEKNTSRRISTRKHTRAMSIRLGVIASVSTVLGQLNFDPKLIWKTVLALLGRGVLVITKLLFAFVSTSFCHLSKADPDPGIGQLDLRRENHVSATCVCCDMRSIDSSIYLGRSPIRRDQSFR